MTGKFTNTFIFLFFLHVNFCSSLSKTSDKPLCTFVVDNMKTKKYTTEELFKACNPSSTYERNMNRDIRAPSFSLKHSIFSNRMLFDHLRDSDGIHKIFQKFKNHVDASGRNRYHPGFTTIGFDRMTKKTNFNKYMKSRINKRSDNLLILNNRRDTNDRFQRSDPTNYDGFSYDFVRFGKRDDSESQDDSLIQSSLGMYGPLYKRSEKYQNLNFGRGGEESKRTAIESTNYDFVRFG
uniref:FMRFamide-related neuropeptides-like n=1 Tax=Strongyloides venezuelensis TaxID=75913 RepID=A0A0K0G0R3_STRVS